MKMLEIYIVFFLAHYCTVYERRDSGIDIWEGGSSRFYLNYLFIQRWTAGHRGDSERGAHIPHFKQAGNLRGGVHSAVLRQGR